MDYTGISRETAVRLMVWRLHGSRSGYSMSSLVYSRLVAFSVSQEGQFSFGKISLMIISLSIAYFYECTYPFE